MVPFCSRCCQPEAQTAWKTACGDWAVRQAHVGPRLPHPLSDGDAARFSWCCWLVVHGGLHHRRGRDVEHSLHVDPHELL
jgi:hypothetical protein